MAKWDDITMEVRLNNGTQFNIIHPVINLPKDKSWNGSIEGELSDAVWTGESHLWIKGTIHVGYGKEVKEIRIFSDNTDFPEEFISIAQIPFDNFDLEARITNLKNIKERFEAFSVLVEEHKKKAIA